MKIVPIQDNSPTTINKALEELEAEQKIIEEKKILYIYQNQSLMLPSRVKNIVVTDEPMYVDPTTGIQWASVKVKWDNNPDEEKVDCYEIIWY